MSVFIAISVVDTLALRHTWEIAIKRWTRSTFRLTKNVVGCKLSHWIETISQVCSAHFVLLFTIERLISVRYPLKRAIICTRHRINSAIVIIVIIAALATTFELYYFDIYKPRKIYMCVIFLVISTSTELQQRSCSYAPVGLFLPYLYAHTRFVHH